MEHTFSMISLGCAKNLVNSEQMLYLMNEAGYALTAEPEDSEIVIINTCGFIDSAKSEAIDTILDIARLKAQNPALKIIVTGCLSERYKDSIADELPEIDAVLGVCDFDKIVEAADTVCDGHKYSSFSDNSSPIDEIPRIVSTGPSWAYLRIAEGCDNFCAFCAIPYIRGRYRSRDMGSIIDEVRDLAAHGIKEIIVIAQDITRYGEDLYGRRCLAELCRKISEVDGVEWIRLHYLYPDKFDDELIDEIANNDKIVKYLDIPIQHINSGILKKMNRRDTGDEIKTLFSKLRSRIPGLVLRTSLIAGLPGESETEFEELCEFLKDVHIERAGVFPFSPEEGTPASKMEHCEFEVAEHRAELINELQSEIMDDFCNSFIGKDIKVLCTGYDEESGELTGRSYADSPDIDGEVHFTGNCPEGEFAMVHISSAEYGILYGEQLL